MGKQPQRAWLPEGRHQESACFPSIRRMVPGGGLGFSEPIGLANFFHRAWELVEKNRGVLGGGYMIKFSLPRWHLDFPLRLV